VVAVVVAQTQDRVVMAVLVAERVENLQTPEEQVTLLQHLHRKEITVAQVLALLVL